MAKQISPDHIATLLDAGIQKFGSQAALARKMGISPSYLNEVLRGSRKPGPKVLGYFGLKTEHRLVRAS